MPVSPDFRELVLEQLERVTPVHARRMFGGVGIYAGDLFFALIDDDTLYFKVDDTNRPDYEALGLGPFRPYGPEGEVMQYYEVPADVLEDPDELRPWVEKAVAVARRKRSGAKKTTKKAAKHAGAALALAALGTLGMACAAAPPPGAPDPSRPQTSVLGVPGGNLYYEVLGEGTPLVLLHAGLMDRRMWDDQVGAFARQGYRVVRYDQRGFGRSSMPDAAYSPVDDLALLLDHLRIDRAHLVGLSMGGNVALDAAIVRPERVRSLVLAASGPVDMSQVAPEEMERIRALVTTAREQGTGAALPLWLAHPMLAPAMERPTLRGRLEELAAENLRTLLLDVRPTPLDPPAGARLGEVRAPTLVLIGGRDTAASRAAGDAAAAGIAGARKVVLAEAGHLINLEEPEKFNRVVLEFLAAH